MKKTKLIVLALAIFILAGCGKTAVQDNPTTPATDPQGEVDTTKPAPEEFEKSSVQNITGMITSIDISAIEVTQDGGEKLTLKIPQEGASFMKQTKQANDEMLLEEIGLLDIPKDQNVDIQYNGQTNEVMLIVVK